MRNDVLHRAYGSVPRELPDPLKALYAKQSPLHTFMARVDWFIVAGVVGFAVVLFWPH